MVYINNLVNLPVEPIKPQISSSKGTAIFRPIVIGLFLVPIAIAHIAALAVSIFGKYSETLTLKLKKLTKKLEATMVHCISLFHPKRLCQAKNVATLDVIWKEKDVKRTEELFVDVGNLSFWQNKGRPELYHPDLKKIADYKVIGAKPDGVCLAASWWTIKKLIDADVKNENELVHLLSPFKEGFPEEVSAQQEFYERWWDVEKICVNREKIDTFHRKIKEVKANKIATMQSKEGEEKAKIQVVEKIASNSLWYFIKSINYLERVAALNCLRLKVYDNIDQYKNNLFDGIKKDPATQERFNQIEEGYYNLIIPGHSIVLIKKDFGTYLFDPTYGLTKCDSKNPANDLIQLIKLHPLLPLKWLTKWLNISNKPTVYLFSCKKLSESLSKI